MTSDLPAAASVPGGSCRSVSTKVAGDGPRSWLNRPIFRHLEQSSGMQPATTRASTMCLTLSASPSSSRIFGPVHPAIAEVLEEASQPQGGCGRVCGTLQLLQDPLGHRCHARDGEWVDEQALEPAGYFGGGLMPPCSPPFPARQAESVASGLLHPDFMAPAKRPEISCLYLAWRTGSLGASVGVVPRRDPLSEEGEVCEPPARPPRPAGRRRFPLDLMGNPFGDSPDVPRAVPVVVVCAVEAGRVGPELPEDVPWLRPPLVVFLAGVQDYGAESLSPKKPDAGQAKNQGGRKRRRSSALQRSWPWGHPIRSWKSSQANRSWNLRPFGCSWLPAAQIRIAVIFAAKPAVH